MRDLMTALLQRAAETPQDVFCWFRGRGRETAYTCEEALRLSARYANLFRAAGLGRGDIVAIILRHAPDLYFSFLGAMLAGCTPSFSSISV